ncbi:hypothetical protein [Nonomuraea roseoviolacea]|uniref:Poly(3-hydroxyalkanoate) polymerase subunit PhaE n=1 Tax=Nonomuraea roseoviolacea subsp. carminata TaxID=160689 RepID=A0ABT1KAG7_9ACTN|nr:hypothetical protein [Nonomuraea roseoviolacea]MCP2350587.1 hypothetical protein [Nonomuraea roseoviolacea subsp. carminata]
MSNTSSRPGWSGDMLDRPEMVEAWAGQLRASLAEYVDYVTRIRRDAEAMWKANPPAEFGSFEAWWRHHKVAGPFARLQEHLEEAVKLTFEVAAQHRRQRHEVPAARQAAAQAKQQVALGRGADTGRSPQPRPAEARAPAASQDSTFLDFLRGERSA